MPTEAFAYGEAISVSPPSGPAGQSVTIFGTGWYDHARLGYDVPILIGTTEVGHGKPKPNDNGEFSVGITIPLNPPPSEIVNGKLRISAIIGNGGSADAFYTISNTTLPNCFDVYFIGVHGSIEGPDGSGRADSPTIVETRNAFEALVRSKGKVPHSELLLYIAPDWSSWENDIHQPLPYVQAGRGELDRLIQAVLRACPTQSFVLVGYSFGAWIIDDWLSQPGNKSLWPNIRAVVLFGDPLWQRTGTPYPAGKIDTYKGIAHVIDPTGLGLPNPAPYSNTPEGPGVGISDRWQSRCLKDDPICGEGYGSDLWGSQPLVAINCGSQSCMHKMYTKANGGYNLTERGANFLALKTFPDAFTTGTPSVAYYETFVEGDFVYIRLYYTGPATGFGFVGANGSGWGFEQHLFSQAPYWARVSPNGDRVDYPFNHLCTTHPENKSEIDAWVYNNTQPGTPVRIPLACSAPHEVITPFFDH